MKKLYFCFILFISLIGTKNSNAQINITNGLVAYYPFSGNANDASGNGLNGSVNSASLTSDRYGNSNSAYEFDGSTSYISVSYNSLLNLTGNKSISIWYYLPTTSINAQPSLVHMQNASSLYYPTFIIQENDHSSYGSNQYKTSFFFGKSTTNYILSTKQLYTNYTKQWIHLAMTYSQSSGYMKIYFNGSISDSLYIGNVTSNSSNIDLQIGRATSNVSTYFKGYLDDIRFYNRELTKDEVAYLYSESLVTIDKVSPISICNNKDSIKINYTKLNNFNSNNTIEFQLSDSNGDFTNYYKLKTNTNNNKGSDSLYLNIPSTIPSSNLYKLRVLTTSPSTEFIWGSKIQIFPKAKPDFYVQNDSQCLLGNNYSFVNQTTIKNGFFLNTWSFGDNTNDNMISPNKSYTKTGKFIVKLLVVSDKGCKDSISKYITVLSSPQTLFFINNPEQCVKNNNYKIINQSTVSSGNLKSYWSFGDGDTSTKLNPEHSFLFKGIYKVSLNATSDNGCSDTISKTIIVNEQPKASFIVDKENQCIRNHEFNFFNTSVTNDKSFKSKWNFGDQTNDTSRNPGKKYTDTGKYLVTQIISSEKNCSDTFEKIIKVLPNPGSYFNIINNDVCTGDSVTFKVKSFNNAYHYKWLRNDTFFGDTLENFFTTNQGKISMITSNNEKCSDTSIRVSTIFKALPIQPIITRIDRKLNAGPGYKSYQWYLNNQVLSGETNQVVEISLNGNYKVSVQNAEDCSIQSENVSVANAGIAKIHNNQIKVYPNPTSGELTIDCEYASKIEIYDLQGRKVQSIIEFKNNHNFSLDNLQEGFYFIKVISENGDVSSLKINYIK